MFFQPSTFLYGISTVQGANANICYSVTSTSIILEIVSAFPFISSKG